MFFDGRCQRTEAYSRQILRKGATFVGAGILLRRHMACMACSGACRENASDNKAKKTNHVRVPSPGRLRVSQSFMLRRIWDLRHSPVSPQDVVQ